MTHSNTRTRSLVTIASPQVARNVVNGGKKYVDWLPIDVTKIRAAAFLSSGRPFDEIAGTHKEAFTRMHIIRNAIAHHSNYAHRKFLKSVVGSKSVPAAQRRPGGYLQGRHAPGQTRFEFHVAETLLALRCLQ